MHLKHQNWRITFSSVTDSSNKMYGEFEFRIKALSSILWYYTEKNNNFNSITIRVEIHENRNCGIDSNASIVNTHVVRAYSVCILSL